MSNTDGFPLGNRCSINYYWDGEQCIPYSKPNACINGLAFDWATYTCAEVATNGKNSNPIIKCREDYFYNGGHCVDRSFAGNCVNGWIWNTTTVNCTAPPSNSSLSTQCSPNYSYYNGEVCVSVTHPDLCVDGWTWSTAHFNCSAPFIIPACLGGYWNG